MCPSNKLIYNMITQRELGLVFEQWARYLSVSSPLSLFSLYLWYESGAEVVQLLNYFIEAVSLIGG